MTKNPKDSSEEKEDITLEENTGNQESVQSEDENIDFSQREKELLDKIEEEKEKKLKALADLDNYRKRTERDKEEQVQLMVMNYVHAIAELIEDFERMIEDLEKPGKEDKIDAFKPILDKAKGILVDNGFQEVQVETGAKFDPSIMEAIGQVPVENEIESGNIVHVAQRAYKNLASNKIVRTAKVIVGKK